MLELSIPKPLPNPAESPLSRWSARIFSWP